MNRVAYHRSYRHLSLPPDHTAWNVLVSVIVDIPLLVFAAVVIRAHGEWVGGVLNWLGVPVSIRTGSYGTVSFAVPEVSAADVSPAYAAIVAIVAAIVMLVAFVPWGRINPYRVLVGMLSFVTAVSGFYFWFAGDRFPYTAWHFAEVWMRAEFTLWVVIPLLFAVVLAPYPLGPGRTLLYSITAVAYAVWFSVIRLSVLLAVFHMAGLVWAAPAYFMVGFLADFIYIVAIYSLATAHASRIIRERQEVWAW